MAVIWKVRPTPSAPDRARAQPGDVAAAEHAPRPASGASWPLSRLKQVVLPAPLGPISASSSPASTAKLTPSTAWTPPKAFAQCLSASRHRSGHRAASRRRLIRGATLAPLEEAADQALREGQHQHDDRGAEHEAASTRRWPAPASPAARRRRRRRRSARSRSARRRAAPSAARRPTWDRHVGREHAALEVGEQPAGDARRDRGEGEGEPVDARHVEADGLRAQRAVAPRAQRVAERREDDARADPARRRCTAPAPDSRR